MKSDLLFISYLRIKIIRIVSENIISFIFIDSEIYNSVT